MNIILFDDQGLKSNLLPLTYIRPTALIRVGILTIKEKWGQYLSGKFSFHTEDYLSVKFPPALENDNLMVNGAVCPNAALVQEIKGLSMGEGLKNDGQVIAFRGGEETTTDNSQIEFIEYGGDITIISQPWQIFKENGAQIRADFELITNGRESQPLIDEYTKVYNQDSIFVEEGVEVRSAVLNAESGPIYLGKNSVVHEGAIVKGPFGLGEGSHVNMGAKIKGDSTIGPFSKVGGEVSNSVVLGYSNKAHDGFLGNSVIGEWCNIGADTNTSNLKNNYADVKIWDFASGRFKDTGETFCGLIMGDHSKSGINTMFNTGTVVGVSANIYGSGFPRNFVPSFAWGGAAGFTTFQMKKVFEVAEKVMARRGQELQEEDRKILQHIFDISRHNRVWES